MLPQGGFFMASTNHTILCYGLSTCIHCKHAREFLDQHKEMYKFIYVDLLEGEERNEALNKMRQYNPQLSFPTIIIDDGERVIVGFQREELLQYLDL